MKCISLFLTAALLLAGCAKETKPEAEKEKAEAPWKVSQNAQGETVVALNEETLNRVGVKTQSPQAGQWVPETTGYGTVVDPAMLAAAQAELEAARGASTISSNELVRVTALAAQGNASAKTVEAAEMAARHDGLLYNAARARFTVDWGKRLLAESPEGSLVRIELPAGQTMSGGRARIEMLGGATNFVEADFFESAGVNRQTQQQRLFFVTTNNIAPGAAVTAAIKTEREPENGVTVPADAILRHQGVSWFYEQTGTGEFTRHEIKLESPEGNGWFIRSTGMTNPVVVTGAQALLSTELSASGFSTGERD